ncbi:MAG: MFS transporter [Bacteroidales bacterium]|nr:MFS transporter [Bacteroidales bacterium]
MRKNRTPFPGVFWIANSVEIIERFAYYGIYFGFPIFFASKGFNDKQLGIIQSLFLFISYTIPILSGTFADKYGFKKILLVSYLAYLPSILLLIFTDSVSGIALSMLCIGLAAGTFKPLISGTIRVVTDNTNRTMGFGIFYAMVNIGGSVGPLVLGWLRAISWQNAYIAAAISIGLMFLITLFFYKEPPRQTQTESLGKKIKDIGIVLSDSKFAVFLIILGVFFWTPFWAFFNLCSKYVEFNLDGAALYNNIRNVLGTTFANLISKDYEGTRKIMGETISHTGWIIMIFQVFVAWLFERFKPIPSFITGLVIMALGFGLLALAGISNPAWMFPGIAFFAIGEMISSPRIQEYIVWIAPKEKAGLYMGTNFLAVGIGGFMSGLLYTSWIYRAFNETGKPEWVWIVLGLHLLVGIIAIFIFSKLGGQFKVQDS